MKMKKLVSAALAGAMALSLSTTALAASVSDVSEPVEVEVSGTTEVPTIKISVPASGSVILNPYRLDVEIGEKDDGSALTSSSQVISATQYIVNESDLAVNVTTSVTGTADGAKFSAATVGADATEKLVYLTFNIAATTDGETEPTTWGTAKPLSTTAVTFDAIKMDKKGGTNVAVGYKLEGDATANPKEAWTTDDTVGAMVTFTFDLVANDAAAAGGAGS